jgi:NAD(P)-dependent dehydrogenase (short-subunit alcohol dehydrogenase family)
LRPRRSRWAGRSLAGASQEIGRTTAEQLAADGAGVAICSRSQERVDPVAEGIRESGGPALAVEWAGHGIRVNCVTPGLVRTPGVAETLGIESEQMPPRETANRRIGHAEDVADVVQFLASDAAAFIAGETVTVRGVPRPGNSFDVDLGLQ